MVEHVLAHNPDDRIIHRSVQSLNKGKLICFPTDTNWVLACDPFNKAGVEALYRAKNQPKSKHFSVLCSSISMATEIAVVSDQFFKFLKKITPGHYTFIFKARKKMIKFVKASKTDHEVGIRIPPGDFVHHLIEQFGGPLMSTNITYEMLNMPENSEMDIYSYLIEETLGHQLDMILDPGEFQFVGESTIIDMRDPSEVQVLREGAGEVSLFLKGE